MPLGIYHGLRFGMVLHPQFPPEVYLEGMINRQSTLSRDHQGPRAVLNALERLASGYGTESIRVRQDLAIAESQLRDYQARLGQPFPHDRYLSDLTDLRDQLKAGLSATGHEAETDKKPDVSELADSIMVLKAANSIEAAPQRVQSKQASVEEPITARIRRRAEAIPVPDPAIEFDAASGAGTAVLPDSAQNSSIKPSMTFRERIALERQGKAQKPSMP